MCSLSPAFPLEGLKRDGGKTEYWKYIQAVAAFLFPFPLTFMGSPDSGTTPPLHPVLSSTSSPAAVGFSIPSAALLVGQDMLGHTLSQDGCDTGCLYHGNPVPSEDLLPPSQVAGVGIWLGAAVMQ